MDVTTRQEGDIVIFELKGQLDALAAPKARQTFAAHGEPGDATAWWTSGM